MKKLYTILKLIVMALVVPSAALAQDFNTALLPTMKLPQFNEVCIDGGVDVELYPIWGNDEPRIIYDLDDNDPKKFSFEVNNKGVLNIKHKLASRAIGIVKVRIYYRDISRMEISRAQVRFAQPMVRTDATLDISLDAGATLSGEVDAIDIEAQVAGDSRLTLNGKCQFFTLDASAQSKVELREVDIFAARIMASLNSIVAARPSTRIEATANSGAIVKYWGEPTIVRSRSKAHAAVVHQE